MIKLFQTGRNSGLNAQLLFIEFHSLSLRAKQTLRVMEGGTFTTSLLSYTVIFQPTESVCVCGTVRVQTENE